MPESALTTFLVHLVVDQKVRDAWEVKKNRGKILSQFGVSGKTREAMLSPLKNTVRKVIQNQQTSAPIADAMTLLQFALKTGKAKKGRKTGRAKKK